MIYLILSLITIPVLIFLSAQDLKERMIYSFPVLFLSAGFAAHSVFLYKDEPVLLVFMWISALILYALYKIFHVWGDGDSDMWLLFTGIILCTFRIESALSFGFIVSIGLAGAQIMALFVGMIEAALKKDKLKGDSQVAVVPGFSLILTVMLVYGIIREVGFV